MAKRTGTSRPKLPTPRPLTRLGRNSLPAPAAIEQPRSILEVFENPKPARDYQIEFVFPEFTSLCPVTGQPDFATITVRYVPDRWCVEMKSLKLYFFAYRDKGVFYESAVNTILDDLVEVLRPRRMTVVGEFHVRGGTAATVTAEYDARCRDGPQPVQSGPEEVAHDMSNRSDGGTAGKRRGNPAGGTRARNDCQR